MKYVDPTIGDDSNDGSSDLPWKTMAKARASAAAGETVSLAPGRYPTFVESAPSGRSLTFRAAGPGVVLDGLTVDYTAAGSSGLVFSGATIAGTVWLTRCRDVQFHKCEVRPDAWAVNGVGRDGFTVRGCKEISVRECLIHNVHRGASVQNTIGFRMIKCRVIPKGGSGVQIAGGCSNTTIEFCHISGGQWSSTEPGAVKNPHASIVSIRSDDVTVRGNIMHGMGSSSGIMCYKPDAAGGEAAYDDITIEGNAIYDVDNTYALRVFNLGRNFTVRNNLLFSRLRDVNDSRYRYEGAAMFHGTAAGHDGSGLKFYNNICIGFVDLPVGAKEGNNVMWSLKRGFDWLAESPSGTSYIVTSSYYGGSALFRIPGFFKNPPNLEFPNRSVADWSLGAEGLKRRSAADERSAFILKGIDSSGFVESFARDTGDDTIGPFGLSDVTIPPDPDPDPEPTDLEKALAKIEMLESDLADAREAQELAAQAQLEAEETAGRLSVALASTWATLETWSSAIQAERGRIAAVVTG